MHADGFEALLSRILSATGDRDHAKCRGDDQEPGGRRDRAEAPGELLHESQRLIRDRHAMCSNPRKRVARIFRVRFLREASYERQWRVAFSQRRQWQS
jgi:hypothetical protein